MCSLKIKAVLMVTHRGFEDIGVKLLASTHKSNDCISVISLYTNYCKIF